MSTLENLRFYADGEIIRDRKHPGQCVRFSRYSIGAEMEMLAQDVANFLNEKPEAESRFTWEPAPALEGNPS